MSEDFEERVRGDYRLSADPRLLDVGVIHRWLSSEAYWARGRSREEVERSIAHSNLYGVVHGAGGLVACARMVTTT